MSIRLVSLVLLNKSAGLSSLPVSQCLCPSVSSYIFKRYTRKSTSRFPAEDAVTRLEDMARKFQPPPYSKNPLDTPADSGIKLDSTGIIFVTYVPPLKKEFIFSIKGLVQRWLGFKEFIKSMYCIVNIKRKLKPAKFKTVEFAKEAQKRFIDVNTALQKNDKASEMIMIENATYMVVKTLQNQFTNPANKPYWRFVKEVEKPRVINAALSAVSENDLYAQVTVRLHTEQILTIRDRFNRIVTGDPKTPRSVIDYVVFERHLPDPYGKWRICGKLNPR
ncbi:large ribosomal subunit protein mL45 isoform X1 [Hydra vulgaris]|uniref:large ribosomal subunit protein mL45 isoform X1 n=1 Tax=Hydra vulgaris TaxID=6087 RepID=UPI0032EA45CC